MSIGIVSPFTAFSSSMLAQPKFEIEQRAPIKSDPEAMLARYRAEHPLLTPQQALASGAQLGPTSDNPLADNHASKIHTEIKLNGKVIARVYNSGGVEIASEYGFLSEEIDFGADKMVGPDLAENRAKRIKAVLERYGAATKDELSPAGLLSATLAKMPILEVLRADTAQTQAQWLEQKAKEGPLDPGMFFSRVA
jgi:hypothetical protein